MKVHMTFERVFFVTFLAGGQSSASGLASKQEQQEATSKQQHPGTGKSPLLSNVVDPLHMRGQLAQEKI